ncbi:MAG: hypothetical protein ACK474_11510 [Pseudanabaena sp.]
MAEIFSCLGDGHDGIWNLFAVIATSEQRFEILDWYHLKEHLYTVGGSLRRIDKAEDLLLQGDVEQAINLFAGCTSTNHIGWSCNVIVLRALRARNTITKNYFAALPNLQMI